MTIHTSKSKDFVMDKLYYEDCQIQDDLLENPVLKGILIAVAFLLVLFNLAIICFFMKYRNLKQRYSKLSDNEMDNIGAAGEIELQQTRWLGLIVSVN